MEYKKDTSEYVIRVARGEKLVESLQAFVKAEKIEGGFFVGLGAADEIELAHYSVEDKKYSTKKFNQPLEITNITGNVAWFGEDVIVHCHGTFSDPEMKCFGGHIVEARISGTLELHFTVTQRLEKQLDEETGLKVMRLFHLKN